MDRAFVEEASIAETDFRKVEAKHRSLVESLAENNVAVWGAGGKGVTFASTIDPEAEMIRCMIDINPKKKDFTLGVAGTKS